MFRIFKIAGIVLAMFFISSNANAELVIIGHVDYEGGELDTQSVRRIFLGQRRSFPDGLKASPLNHAAGSPDRKEFFDSVLIMGESSYRRHWARMRSTGKGNSPDELSSYQAILSWVAENPGSIAYIDARMVNDSVKVLLKVEDYVVETDDLSETENRTES